MKTPTAAAAVTLAASLIVTSASAQSLGSKLGRKAADPNVQPAQAAMPATPATNPGAGTGANSRETLKDGAEVAAPAAVEEFKPVVPLPTEPLEPYMLTRQNGPFMVLAHTFRGPEAPRQALALVLELRNQFHLPAYILLPRKFPGKSMIRGVPPQAPAFVLKDDVGFPEIVRALDEAAVLVGDEKTVKDSTDLLHKVKKLHPACIDGLPQMWHWRKGQGLSRAIRTTNPFVPAEQLFPQQQDILIGKMNEGPHNIRNCPGNFTLQIATFSGRSTFDPENDQRFKGVLATKKSPLATAADDAERLAAALAKDKEIQKTGSQPYVFHDRFSSRVTMGSFGSPNDPAAQRLHDRLIEIAVDLNQRRVTDTLIVPAAALLDLTPIKRQFSVGSQLRAN